MLKQHLYLPLLLIAALSACATNPLTGRNQFIVMSDAQLEQMGLQAFRQLKQQMPLSQDAAHNQFTDCVANALVRQLGGQWEVVVFKEDTPNAFALPGNRIGVHTGMLKLVRNQDQLATVIAHEIGHVLSRHSNERASQRMAVNLGLGLLQKGALGQSPMAMAALGLGAQFGVLMPYSRIHEREADVIGQRLMAVAGFDPRQSVVLWQNMKQATGRQQQLEFLSTHPADATRIQDLQQGLAQNWPLYEQAQAAGLRPNCH